MINSTTHFVYKSKRLLAIPISDAPLPDKVIFVDLTNNLLTCVKDIIAFPQTTTLRINKNKLECLSPEIRSLSNLKILDFSSNYIETIPVELSLLTNLQELSFDQNKVTTFPIELSTLENLQRLYVSANYLDALPHTLTTYTNLRVLELGNNSFTKVPRCISSFQSLTTLHMDYNRISHVTKSLSSLTNLLCLTFNNNKLESFPSSVCRIPSLTSLEMNSNNIVSISPSISLLTNLKSFFVDSNKLTSVASEITQLTKLNTFSMANHFCRELPNLSSLSKMTYFNFGNGRLSKVEGVCGSNCLLRLYQNLIEKITFADNGTFELIDLSSNRLNECPSFSQLPKLFKLDLSKNRISNFTISSIHNMLVSLDISYNLLTDLPSPLFLCSNIVSLNISCCRVKKIPNDISKLVRLEQFLAIDNKLEVVNDSVTSLTQLTMFCLQSNRLETFPVPILFIQNLKYLSLANNMITNVPMNVTGLDKLETVDISCNNLTEVGPFVQLPNLQDLNLSYNSITTVPSKITELKSLHSLNLIGNQLEKISQNLSNQKTIARLQYGKQSRKGKVMKEKTQRSTSPYVIAPSIDLEKVSLLTIPEKCQYFQSVEVLSTPTLVLSEMQGRRVDMQDSVCLVQNFCGKGYHLLSLFDGHGGAETARLCTAMFPSILARKLNEVDLPLTKIMEDTFYIVNEEVKKRGYMDGSAALVVLVTPFKYCVANAGDSRALLIRFSSMEVLSHDHKPTHPEEYKRLRKERGFVDPNGRTNGMAAVSRAIGDIDCQPALTCFPETLLFDRKDKDLAIILACDGVWDVMSNEEVCDVVRAGSLEKDPPERTACYIRDIAYARNSGDNISCVVCKLE
ncbi:adenylate cyclase, putative [Entamoeba invadens IP1]|uniref:Adenylate cyclase, putative n=1 Tax=Entamoeba invadens IP1 TaxID=370355 RepID=A0A0A1U7R3_ENTIV|nr:adenylate cyclase, putative [Entamoeba invadens IP1]ELP90361.1 adenylate cyclase, putative [Entamoeba invadens IP1]|eukprot:XP_004257132.1 adenylate cyclase, putative [Entamoeba invadens IP1]